MTRKEWWNSLTEEERSEIRVARQANKKLARELVAAGEERELSDEEQAFVKEHRKLSRSERKERRKIFKKQKLGKLKDRESRRIKHAKRLEHYINKREKFLHETNIKINSTPKIVCIDVEKFMYNDRITEVGITMVIAGVVTPLHYIIKENYKYRNKTIKSKNNAGVEDNKDGFTLSNSIHISIEELPAVLKHHTDDALIIGHAFYNDIGFLKNHFTFDRSKIIDTQTVAKFFYKENREFGLKFMLKDFDIQYEGLHNAGNDAFYTFKIMKHMLDGKPSKKLEEVKC